MTCDSHSWFGQNAPLAVKEKVSLRSTCRVVQIRSPAFRCHHVSFCAGIRNAASAIARKARRVSSRSKVNREANTLETDEQCEYRRFARRRAEALRHLVPVLKE